AAIREGLRVPSELAVIVHDDSPIPRRLVPSLSSIRFDTTGLGRHLAALALAAAAGGPPPTAQRPPTHARAVHRVSTRAVPPPARPGPPAQGDQPPTSG